MGLSEPKYFLKALYPNTITLRGRASTYELWEDPVQAIAMPYFI